MDNQQAKLVKWNPSSAEYNHNPYLNLAECREHNPIQQGIYGEWVLFRYEHIKQLLRDPSCITADLSGFFEKKEPVILKNTNQCPFLSKTTKKWLMYLDGDDHKVARELVERALKSYDLEQHVNESLDKWFAEFFNEEKPDLASVVSVLPSLVFVSFYQPTSDEWKSYEHLKKISHSLASSQDVYVSIKKYQAYNADAEWIFTTISKDFDNDELTESALVKTLKRINAEMGSPFSNDELVSVITIMFFGALETTVDSVTTGILEFFKDPSLIDYVLNADAKQINIFAEELLRFAAPQQYTIRINPQPIEIEGIVIPANSKIFLSLASANRDPAVFENPEQIVPDRSYNPHLTFGSGSHTCVGAKLARLELRTLLKPLAKIIKGYSLEEGVEIEWQRGIFMRGVKNLFSVKKQVNDN